MTTPQSPSLDGGADRLSARAWGALLVLCGALFLDALDVSMIGVALPSIRTDLGMSTSSLQWVVSGYVLGYGGFLLLGGRAADLLGRRRMFLISLGVFIVASGLGGLANDGGLLIATRFIKGISAAFTAPAGLSIITTSFAEGPARNRALSIYTATGATGFSLGLVFGGLLTEIGWRWVFFLPVPVALIILLAAIRLVPTQPRRCTRPPLRRRGRPERDDRDAAARLHRSSRRPTWAGPRRARSARSRPRSAILAAFVWHESRTPRRSCGSGSSATRTLVRANLGAMSLIGGWFGIQFIATLYMQSLRGWSALETGLAIFPGGLLVAADRPAPAAADRALRRLAPDRRGPGLDGRGLRAVPADRAAFALRTGPAADVRARRPGLRARLRAAEHRGDDRRRAARAGPGRRPREHVVPVRRRARARRGNRRQQRQRDPGTAAGRARRLPRGDLRLARRRRPRRRGHGAPRPRRAARPLATSRLPGRPRRHEVVAFTAAQIPGIDERALPAGAGRPALPGRHPDPRPRPS